MQVEFEVLPSQIRETTKKNETPPELVQRLQQSMEAQRAAIETIPVNETLVRSAAQDLAAVQADMAVEQARLHSDIFAVLTVEQQDKAKQLEAQERARANERRQRASRAPRRQV